MVTLPRANLVVSFVISTHNRRGVLIRTLAQLHRCGLSAEGFEILVVDNASRDRTADTVQRQFPRVRVIRMRRNRGACAKNIAIHEARGRYVIFLDDDSFPAPGSVARMVRHFEADPHLGAAVFTITLPDGSQECSAYPDVFIGCGTGFRRRALIDVGGLPNDFFMQAEEYDLSLRLLDAGWDVQRFDDLNVTHLKTPSARRSWRTMRLDVRNNFIVAMRYLPSQWRWRFARDWMRRYWKIAASKGQRTAFVVGLLGGLNRITQPRYRRTVTPDVFEQFARVNQIKIRLFHAKQQHKLRSLLFIDYGKNMLPYWLAARACGLEVVAIADERLAGSGTYRGIPIVTDAVARKLEYDAAIISNSSPVHAAQRAERWQQLDGRKVIDLLATLPMAVPVAQTPQQRAMAA
jgi:hypothetical protein